MLYFKIEFSLFTEIIAGKNEFLRKMKNSADENNENKLTKDFKQLEMKLWQFENVLFHSRLYYSKISFLKITYLKLYSVKLIRNKVLS